MRCATIAAAAAAARTRNTNILFSNIGAAAAVGVASSLNFSWPAPERNPKNTSSPLFLNLIINKVAFPLQCQSHRRSFIKLTSLLTAPSSSSSSLPSIMSQFHVVASQNGGLDHNVFPLSPGTGDAVLKINKGDITEWFVDASSDAIVNPANERMLGGGGADGAIHRAAGPELRDACYNVPEVRPGVRCPTGEARITPGFKLPVSYVIHTVGPIYDADPNPEASLRNAYRNSLTVAKDNNIKYIAFPAISCGVYGYPFEEAATVAISAIREFSNDFKEVHFVLFSDQIFNVWLQKAKELLQV